MLGLGATEGRARFRCFCVLLLLFGRASLFLRGLKPLTLQHVAMQRPASLQVAVSEACDHELGLATVRAIYGSQKAANQGRSSYSGRHGPTNAQSASPKPQQAFPSSESKPVPHASSGDAPPSSLSSTGYNLRDRSKIKCYNCGGMGHIAKYCDKPKKQQREKSGQQGNLQSPSLAR